MGVQGNRGQLKDSIVELGQEGVLLGLALNAAQGGGVLEVTAEGGTTHEAWQGDPDGIAPGREMVHVVHACSTPLRGGRFRFHLAADSPPGAFLELEAAVFRRGVLPPSDGAAPAAGDGETLTLAPLEVALAEAALASRDAEGPKGGLGQIERQFRRLLAGEPPAWARHPANVARFLAQLGVALGDDRAARRLLLQASKAHPEAEELRGDLARLVRRMEGV